MSDLFSTNTGHNMLPLLSIFTITLYIVSVFLQGFSFKNQSHKCETWTTLVGSCAILSHGIFLLLSIHYYHNLNLSKLVSVAFWFINFLTYLSSLEKRNIQNLGLFTFPLAAISLLFVIFFNHTPGFIDASNPKQLFHILLSTLTFTAISLAALQAIILTIQDKKLRKHHSGFLSLLPSIESMETFLFRLLTIGFFLLTVLLVSSIFLFSEIQAQKLIHKLTLSLSAWVILTILLGGRFYYGWRGQTVVRWTLLGTALLMLIYFGSLFSQSAVFGNESINNL